MIGKSYDIILLLGHSRRHAQYLSIIKYLPKNYKIAVIQMMEERNNKTNIQFENLIKDFGIDIFSLNKIFNCKILIFPHMLYEEELLFKIKNHIKFLTPLALMSFASGLSTTQFIDFFNIKKLLLVEKKFFLYTQKFEPRRREGFLEDKKLIEIGLPFKKYPLFPKIKADYLLSVPTNWSFPHETDKHNFFKTILALYNKIDDKDIIIFKPHNGSSRDYLLPFPLNIIHQLLPPVFINYIAKFFALFSDGANKNSIANRIKSVYLYKKVLQRTLYLSKLTPYSSIAMEVFLPNIKKGVIGGLSNTMWTSLYFNKPFYNCVDISIQKRKSSDRLYSKKPRGGESLEFNLEYFGIPFCSKNLKFNKENLKKITKSARTSDIIKFLEKELKKEKYEKNINSHKC